MQSLLHMQGLSTVICKITWVLEVTTQGLIMVQGEGKRGDHVFCVCIYLLTDGTAEGNAI